MRSTDQEIRFCKSSDGVTLAYATMGSGPPLVKAANWLNHLEYDWKSAVWRHWLTELSRYHTFIRYDERGCGLSDWNVEEFSLDAWVRDLEAVVDAAELDRFPLLGISQGGPIAIAYASKHPERVSQLILYGSYAAGLRCRDLTPKALEEAEFFLELIKVGWGKKHSAFRQVFTSLFIPGASADQADWFNELQRVSSSPENAARLLDAFYNLDVRDVAAKLEVPTLVLHAKDDLRIPFVEGRQLASLIRGSRFVPLEGRNHILLSSEPAWETFLREVRNFLGVSPAEQETIWRPRAYETQVSSRAPDGRWKEISALFERAAGLGATERNELLARVTDSNIRSEVESLLRQNVAGTLPSALSDAVQNSLRSFDAAHDDLAGRAIAHYRILEKLGEGGMGTIYKARDLRLDRLVALKFLPFYFSAQTELKLRFVQEAKAAAALDHANICTIFEIAEDAGQLYISMPCYQGETLKDKIERGPLEIDDAMAYVAQAAEALAHAHAAGIIHRDIKPANLFVTHQGQLKVLDFGVAKVTNVNLTNTGVLVGTINYMSPEQATGRPVNHRTDMWSLGVVLYEMLAGKHPFAGESGVSLYAIQHEQPASIRSLRPEVSPSLDAMLERLLAKDAADRYETFVEFLAELRPERAMNSSTQISPSTFREKPSADPGTNADSFASGADAKSLVGREPEMKHLAGLLKNASAGAGRIVFISGEPGMGKTSLCAEFLKQAKKIVPGLICLTGQCVEQYGSSEAYLPFLNAFSRSLKSPARSFLEQALISHAPAWSIQFTSILATSDIRAQLRQETMGATPERMLREMGEYLSDLARKRTIVLLLEDLHWADPSSLNLVRYLGHLIGQMKMMVIGTFRPEEVEHNQPLLNCTRELQAHDQSEEISLGVLDRKAIADHLDARFAPNDFAAELAVLIERKTGGHPLFTTRLARDLKEREAIVKTETGWVLARDVSEISLEIPESVLALIRRRIETLSEIDQRLLQYASVQGEEFLSHVLAQALTLDQLETEERLDRLAKASHLLRPRGEEELPDGSITARYQFVHALYRNVLYEDMLGSRRREVHRQTGELLRNAYGEKSAQIASQLALHFERARDFRQAIQHLIQVADNAARVHASTEAVKHLTRALELVAKLPADDRPAVSASVYVKRGAMNLACSRFDETIADFEQAIELAKTIQAYETQHAALNGLIITFFIAHRLDETNARAEEALKLGERVGNRSHRFETIAFMAQQKTCLGELDLAIRLNEQVLAGADSEKDQAAWAMARLQRGEVCLHQSEYARAQELIELGVQKALNLGDNFKYLYGLFMLGMAQANAGKISKALASFEKLRSVSERNGDRAWLVRCPNTLGWVYRELQDLDRAEAEDKKGADMTRESEFQEVLAHSLINLSYDRLETNDSKECAAILSEAEAARDRDIWMQWRHNIRLQAAQAETALARNDCENASTYAQELLRVAAKHKARKYVALAHKILGEIALSRRAFAEAEKEMNEAAAILDEFPAPLVGWKLHASLGNLHLENGDVESARRAFDKSIAIINEIAANTEEPDLRQTFLNSDPVQSVLQNATE